MCPLLTVCDSYCGNNDRYQQALARPNREVLRSRYVHSGLSMDQAPTRPVKQNSKGFPIDGLDALHPGQTCATLEKLEALCGYGHVCTFSTNLLR